jgi:hypothetical protein
LKKENGWSKKDNKIFGGESTVQIFQENFASKKIHRENFPTVFNKLSKERGFRVSK